ncbi:glycosyltransferase [Moorena sp. SIO4A5]|uniref:glycosyltransferase n=1 Tax=Moorena sp. SIO4A5 TaxID=2607838 RepID=UPI0013CC2FB9|nr:glycosyltransferase [Moorena sp. SIO4A5]NEO21431.1 glycosyltransferase family 4 protein [Moorena sp. SIO4A5]
MVKLLPKNANKAEFDILTRILYVQYTNPAGYPPLEHSSGILADQGWQVIFLGTGALGANNLSFPPHPNIEVKQIPFCTSGWRQKLHYLWFCIWVVGWTLRWQPQWIYASDLLACPISLFLSFLPNLKLIYHEHDSPGLTPGSSFIRFCLATRKKLAHRAAFCILPNQQRADSFDKIVNNKKPSLCVWNCPSVGEVMPPRSPWGGQTLWLLYHGSIVPSQLPETIIQAMTKLPESIKLRIVGYETIGHIGYVKYLQELAEQLNISDRIKYLGTVPTRAELLEKCHSSDVGLSLFPAKSLQPMPGASNKPFDYLACALPLLVSDLPDWKEMYVEPGYGLAANPEDPESIARALRWYLEHPKEMREMGENGRKRILEEWNYEKQFEAVIKVIRY